MCIDIIINIKIYKIKNLKQIIQKGVVCLYNDDTFLYDINFSDFGAYLE